jgi:quinolinate synthase
MKMNTLEKAFGALERMSPELVLSPDVIQRARAPIEKMLDWSLK